MTMLTTEFQKVLEASTKVTQNVTGYLRLYLKYGGRNETTNKDTIYYEIRQYAANPYGNYDAWSWASALPYNIYLGGTKKTSGTYTQSAIKSDGKEKSRASGSWEQSHNSDGTWSSSISFDGYVYKTKVSASGNISLPDIPRATSISATDAMIGSVSTIALNIASTSFKHTLKAYVNNALVETIATDYTSSTKYWTVPSSIYAKIPSAKQVQVKITCDTYSGTTLVGSKETTMWASINETQCKPTISTTITNDGTSGITYQLTNSTTSFIKGYTKANISSSVSLKNSATLKEYKVVNGNKSITSQTGSIDAISEKTFYFYVKDSRDLTPTTGYPVSVNVGTWLDYFSPRIKSMNISRVEQMSKEVQANISGEFWNNSFGAVTNTLKYAWRVKESSSSSWGDWSALTELTPTGNNFSITNLSLGTNYLTDKSYDFQFKFIDALGNLDTNKIVTSKQETVSISIPITEIGEDYVMIAGTFYICVNNEYIPIFEIVDE